MAVYDCFLFLNEFPLLDVRLHELDPVVDYFVLVESNKTHSGKNKPLHFFEQKDRFSEFAHKIINVRLLDSPPPIPTCWVSEHFQRNAITRGLTNCKDDDLILISDCDEIPRASKIEQAKSLDYALFQQRCYTNYLDCYVGIWNGTLSVKYKNLKTTTPQHLRDHRCTLPGIGDAGWHFTWLGGPEQALYKLESYAHNEFDNDTVKSRIAERIDKGRDILLRNEDQLSYTPIDDYYPLHIIKNIQNYRDLIHGS